MIIEMPDISKDIAIVSSNLRYLTAKQRLLDELRQLEIGELPLPVIGSSGLSGLIRWYHTHIPYRELTLADRVCICRRLLDIYGDEAGPAVFSSGGESTAERITYVSNQYSEAAFRVFSAYTGTTDGRVCRSFSELCDDIGSGANDACIMPIESTSDGKLMSFYSLIDRFELKIVMTCDIESSDGAQITRYALLRRRVICPENGSPYCFEFSFTSSEGCPVNDILSAAALCDLHIYRIDSMPLRYNESVFVFYPILRGLAENIVVFALFLTLNLSQYNAVGVYNHIQQEKVKR